MTRYPRTIGIDLGSRKSACCTLRPDGEIEVESTMTTSRQSFEGFFAEEPTSRVILEACGVSRWVAQIAESHGHEVIVANPRRLALITSSTRKSDRNDAYKLADLGQVRPRLLHPIHRRGERSHLAQIHLRVRSQLVQSRTALGNCIRGCARTTGHPMPKCSTQVFPKRCRERLPEGLLELLLPLIEQIESLNRQIAACNERSERIAEEHFSETGCLRQVPGVGPVLSLAFAASIEDASRFKSSRSVGAYFGLAPRSRQSGSKAPQLRISKRGDPELRRLLVSAATYILGPFGPDSDLKRYGKRITSSGSQSARAKARIAVARKLAVLLHRLWTTGEVYRPLNKEQATA
ncbi:MAG: IS110 family transposase [Planctomycetota bacterium]